MSLLTALEEPAPAGPPVAPPAVVADALPEPEPCALSRVPLGSILSLLTALEEPAPAGPPVAPPAAAASPELAPCASASVEPSVSTQDKTIVVSFMGYPFLERGITGAFIRVFRTNAKSPLSKLDFGRSFLPGLSQREGCAQKMATWLNR